MSQNLKGIFKFVPAISIISKKKLLKYKNVIGEKPYKYLISKPINIDIDTVYDYELAKLYEKNYLI
jgi:CMP-N-acetylneuraminic acid synthetase